MKSIDPLQLQRLVDGELNGERVQQILANAQGNPDHWQEIASAFVENQTWSQAFQSKNSSVETDLALAGASRKTDSKDSCSKHSPANTRRSNMSRLALAASLLLAATIGYMVNQIQSRQLPVDSIANVDPDSNPDLMIADNSNHETPPRITTVDYQPVCHLEVPEEHLGAFGSAGPIAPVPLYAVNSADQLKQLNQQRYTPAVPVEILEELVGSGYQMKQDVNFISGRLGDGRSFVVPVRTVWFQPEQ